MSHNIVKSALDNLTKSRPIFHSEADFQHALAWELQRGNTAASIRLEKQISLVGPRVHLDLLYQAPGEELAIELKYKTRLLQLSHEGEMYSLRNQSAQDIGRHDFIKDVQRLENFVLDHPGASGVAVILTNDRTYWNETKKSSAVDSAFRIHEGRVLQGSLTWGGDASDGTKANREEPLVLKDRYQMQWSDYSTFGPDHAQQFRYLLLYIRNVHQTRAVLK